MLYRDLLDENYYVTEDIKIISEEEFLKGLSDSDKRSYNRLSKRAKEEIRFQHSLGPEMDFDKKFALCEQFSYRPDKDTIDALRYDRIDCDERRTAFVEAFRLAVAEDDESLFEVGEYACRGLQTNNAERLLYALCGYGANDLAKCAGIIPDDADELSDNGRRTANLVVRWTNGKETSCECEVRQCDFKICNFRRKIFRMYADTAEIENVFVRVKPNLARESRMFSCIDEDERRASNDMLSYWYSMTPCEEDDDIDPDDE